MFNQPLFSRPSFISGVARSIDIGGTLNQYNYSSTPDTADSMAIMSDWLEVGRDIHGAISDYEKSTCKETKTKD